jgi:hypothetical protein
MITSESLVRWLLVQQSFNSRKVVYKIEQATTDFVVFAGTPSTGRVMLPTSLIAEWIDAAETRRIAITQSPREMRAVVQKQSTWANHLHSFETHLAAVVHRWATDGLEGDKT